MLFRSIGLNLPGTGKTCLALNIAEQIALKSRIPTLYFSFKACSTEVAERLLCVRGGLSREALRAESCSDATRHQLTQAAREVSVAPFSVADAPTQTTGDMNELVNSMLLKRKDGNINPLSCGKPAIQYSLSIASESLRDPQEISLLREGEEIRSAPR